MSNVQPGIMAPVPEHARYLCFSLKASAPRTASPMRCSNSPVRFPAATSGARRCGKANWICGRWGCERAARFGDEQEETLETESEIMPFIEWVAMKDVNRALVSPRDHRLPYRVVSANGAG